MGRPVLAYRDTRMGRADFYVQVGVSYRVTYLFKSTSCPLGSAAAVLGALRMDLLTPELKEIMPFDSIKEAWEVICEKAENGCAFC